MANGAAISKRTIEEALKSCRGSEGGKAVKDLSVFAKSLGRYIAEQFSGIRLIGEIERVEARKTYEALTSCLSSVLSGADLLWIVNNGNAHWRAILSLYFVWTGVFLYGDEAGHDLWPPIFKGLGISHDGPLSARCGQIFMQCLKEHDLETFDSVKEGHVYLTRILLHGLLPEKHIDCFMRELIDTELRTHLGFYSTGEYIVSKWVQSSGLQYLPKPIQRFIQYGRPVNTGVIDRVLDMARRWNEEDTSLWRQWGLPQYIVNAFRRHLTQAGSTPDLTKAKASSTREKPYVWFSLEESDAPLLHVPSLCTKARADLKVLWVDVEQESRQVDHVLNMSSADGLYRSIPFDVPVGPCEAGWFIEIIDGENRIIDDIEIPLEMPLSHAGTHVPLFLFCRATGKLIHPDAYQDLPTSVLMVYPSHGEIEIHGGSISTQPERLYGFWRGWQYALCTLEGEGTIVYLGQNASSHEEEIDELTFSTGQSDSLPALGNEGQAPVWIRSLGGYPIYSQSEELSLVCTERTFPRWRHAFGKIVRLDKDVSVTPLDLDFRKEGKVYRAKLSSKGGWEPGVYEIRLRGPLGLDDVILPFTYLPFSDCELAGDCSQDYLADEFRLRMPFECAIEPLHRTQISRNGKELRIFPLQDKGEAFCALEFFHGSLYPIVILFARNAIRWARRSETGLFHWEEWRSLPEELPIHRVDELADARVAIQMDHEGSIKRSSGKKLKVSLIAQTESDDRMLMSYDAPSFTRGVQDTWVIDIKRFSDHFKSLTDFESAAIAVRIPESNSDYSLFHLLRNPCLAGFRVDCISRGGDFEKLRIDWEPQPNDPQAHRKLFFFPAVSPRQCISRTLPDRAMPPFEEKLETVKKAELWSVQHIVERSRFGCSRRLSSDSKAAVSWFRAPTGWYDWLEWYELSHKEVLQQIGDMGSIDADLKRKSLPWTGFLTQFHFGKGEEIVKAILSALDPRTLCSLLPYRPGTVWEAKAGTTVCLLAQVTRSSVGENNLNALLDHEPLYWGQLNDSLDLELSLTRYHPYHGNAGCVWRYTRNGDDLHPLMCSETAGELELPYWLEDAIAPAKRGVLVARCDLERFWDSPPVLPIVKGFPQKEVIFLDYDKSEQERPGKWTGGHKQGRSIATFGDLISQKTRSDLTKGYFETGESENRRKAEQLLRHWQNWSKRLDVNRFLARMISGRLTRSGINSLSGVAAILARLRAYDNWNDCFFGRASCDKQSLSELYEQTVSLVRTIRPKSFLTDLILSEIIIYWYWNKHIAAVG